MAVPVRRSRHESRQPQRRGCFNLVQPLPSRSARPAVTPGMDRAAIRFPLASRCRERNSLAPPVHLAWCGQGTGRTPRGPLGRKGLRGVRRHGIFTGRVAQKRDRVKRYSAPATFFYTHRPSDAPRVPPRDRCVRRDLRRDSLDDGVGCRSGRRQRCRGQAVGTRMWPETYGRVRPCRLGAGVPVTPGTSRPRRPGA